MKRFSKIVSVTMAAPSATDISAMNCACMSVGKPGYGSVIASAPRRPSRRRTRSASSPSVISTPALRSASATAPRWANWPPSSRTSPPVMAAAQA